ncbi:MAG: hypothetical protein KY475_07460 [Planctomycetes bacterium]|nr:hypothetical protein [Planctomycetota bacterium]
MLLDRETLGRHVPWLVATALIAGAAVAWYAVEALQSPRWPGGSSLVGLATGVLAAMLILFEFLIWPRKGVRAWRRLGSARVWMRAHIWMGLLTVPLTLVHGGIVWGGVLSTVLMWLFLAVIASGVIGLAVQQIVPKMLLRQVPEETIHSEIEQVARQNAELAEDLVLAACGPPSAERAVTTADVHGSSAEATAAAGAFERRAPRNAARTAEHPPPGAGNAAGEVGGLGGAAAGERRAAVVGAVRSPALLNAALLKRLAPDAPAPNAAVLQEAFYGAIRPFLLDGKRSGSPLGAPDQAAAFFRELRSGADDATLAIVEALEQWCAQRRQLDLQRRLHFWLHAWLTVHVPLSVALLLVLGVHIVVALKYW